MVIEDEKEIRDLVRYNLQRAGYRVAAAADDYLTTPFSPRELVARIKALLRRARPERADETVEVGELRVDRAAREASFRGRALTLTPREFELLAFLSRNPGRVLSREELL